MSCSYDFLFFTHNMCEKHYNFEVKRIFMDLFSSQNFDTSPVLPLCFCVNFPPRWNSFVDPACSRLLRLLRVQVKQGWEVFISRS